MVAGATASGYLPPAMRQHARPGIEILLCLVAVVGRLAIVALVAVGASACGLDNPGVNPPAETLNFPMGLATTPNGGHLFVTNSNFDLRYNAGSLQAYDLDRVAGAIAACTTRPCEIPVSEALTPGGEVLVGAFVSGLAVAPSGERVYLSVRSETNLTFVDFAPATGLDCGGRRSGGGAPPRCADHYRRGDEASATERNIRLPGDPMAIAAGRLSDLGLPEGTGDFVLMAHRAGRASLFLDRVEGTGTAPVLVHVVSDLPDGIANLRFDTDTRTAWLMSASSDRIGRIGIALDEQSRDLIRSFLFNAGSLQVEGLDCGTPPSCDTRDIRFETRDSGRRFAYALSRRPEAVLFIDRELSNTSLEVVDIVDIGRGPSRLDLAQLIVGGSPRSILLASCFDSRDVYVIDPAHAELLAVIRGMSGPFELSVDPARNLLYVADFRSSVVRIVDLTPLVSCLEGHPATSCEPTEVAHIGRPRVVGELQ